MRAMDGRMFVIAVLVMVLLVTPSSPVVAQSQVPSFDYVNPILDAINMTEIEENVEYFSNLGSRFTGYPGCQAAASYIAEQFGRYGMDVEFFPYDITVPLDEGAYIELSSGKVDLYPLLPNLVCPPQTPPGGLVGELVYAGDGEIGDFDGKNIEGSIVVMDFNSGYNWVTAAKIGAKAVVFIEPSETSVYEAETKVLDEVAYNFPRLLVKTGDVNALFEDSGQQVKLVSNMKFRTVEATNVIGYMPGETDQCILLTAHYDSYSWVPSVSPGASESVGISILLQLAKFFSANPDKHTYTLVFIAFSGTDQGNVGSRMFVREKIREEWDSWGKNVVLQINVDIRSGMNAVVPTVMGGWITSYYANAFPWAAGLREWWLFTLKADMAKKMSMPELVDNIYFGDGAVKLMSLTERLLSIAIDLPYGGDIGVSSHLDSLGFPVNYLDHEPLLMAGGPAVSFYDWLSCHKYWGTPVDTPENINWYSVQYKLKIIYPLIYATANTDLVANRIVWEPDVKWKPMDLSTDFQPGDDRYPLWKDSTMTIMQYNFSKSWYDPVPKAIIAYRAGTRVVWNKGLGGARVGIWSYTFADEEGIVSIPGANLDLFYAFVVNETTGMITYAPGFGSHWFATETIRVVRNSVTFTDISLWEHVNRSLHSLGIYTLQPVGSIVFFDVGDPYLRNTPQDTNFELVPRYHITRSAVEDYSWTHLLDGFIGLGVAVLYVPPNEPIDIYMRTSWTMNYPLVFLNNASATNLDGTGFAVRPGEQEVIRFSNLQAAEDMLWINIQRNRVLESHGITASTQEILYVEGLIQEAKTASTNLNYTRSLASAQEALAKARDLYMDTRLSIEEASTSITYTGFVLIPFAIFAERLFASKSGFKRLIIIILLYIVPILSLWVIHPGFDLASNAVMLLVAFSVLVLLSPPTGIIFFLAFDTIKKLRVKTFGVHFSELPRSTVALASFTTGIQNMRKRPLRTGLMLASITIISAASVLFTSLSAITVIRPSPTETIGRYDGIMIRQWGYSGVFPAWDRSRGGTGGQVPPQVSERLVDELRANLGNITAISVRGWVYPLEPLVHGTYVTTMKGDAAYRVPVHALLGLSPEENGITIDDTRDMIAGRWFTEADNMERRNVAIIGNKMADALNITKSQIESATLPKIRWAGDYVYAIVGIVNDTTIFYNALDLDNIAITPTDLQGLPSVDLKLDPSQTIIMPYKTLMTNYGDTAALMSCAIKFDPQYATEEYILEKGKSLYEDTGINLFVSFGGQVYAISELTVAELMGWTSQIVPLILAALTILNLLIGSIQERTGEIEIYSVVGLSPFHISFFFLAEAVSYALVGTVLGYVLGVFGGYAAHVLNLGIALTYYGTQVVTSVIIILGMVLVTSVYPIIKVSRLVTPSLERRWRMTKPRGSEWRMPFPFVVSGEEEASGLTRYIQEFLSGHKAQDSATFQAMDIEVKESETEEERLRVISFRCRLEPYELNINQDVSFEMARDKKTGSWSIELYMKLVRGSRKSWETFNRAFADLFRKQFLIWRSFSQEEREEYMKGDVPE